MPYAAPYQQKYPPTQKPRASPGKPGFWENLLFNGGGQPERLYGGNQRTTGIAGMQPVGFHPKALGAPLGGIRMPGARSIADHLQMQIPNGPGRGWDGFDSKPYPGFGATDPGLDQATVDEFRGFGGKVGPSLRERMSQQAGIAPPGATPNQVRMAQLTGVPLSESLAYARASMQPVARGTVPSVGSANPSMASINNINAQMLTDPTNIEAQFSSQLGQPTNDELALKAWNESRGKGGFTREGALANANRGAYDPATGGYRTAVSVYDAIRDPNFNANGAQFGGATIGMDARGRTFFTDKERGPDPGAAAREERRLAHMAQLAARGQAMPGDDRPPQPYLQQQSRLPPGTPSGASLGASASWDTRRAVGERSAVMQAKQAERMAKVTERAGALAEQRKANLAARRQGPSLMDQLAQRNPELAVRMMEGQQRERFFGQNAQNQMQIEELRKQGRLEEAQALANGNLAVANARAGVDERIADKDAAAKRYVADAERAAADARLTGEQKAAATGQFMAWATANPNATAQQRNEMLNAIVGQQGGQQAQPAPGGWGGLNVPPQAQQAPVAQGAPPPVQAAPPVAQGPFAEDPQVARNKTEKIHWGELTQDEYDDLVKHKDDPRIVSDKLMAKYKDKKKASAMLNKLYGNSWFGTTRRSVDNPSWWGGWSNYLQSPEFMPYDMQGQPSEFF